MEFVCVLSVNGSLASYLVRVQEVGVYEANLRGGGDKRKDIPREILLKKENEDWKVEPWHDEIAPALMNAIESGP